MQANTVTPTPRLRAIGCSILTLLGGMALSAQAQSLTGLYDSARGYDAAYQSARAQYEANLAKVEQTRALILPSASLTAGASRTHLDVTSAALQKTVGNQSAGVSVSQPLYRPANLATYEQGKRQLLQAEEQLRVAEQDLVVRVAQAYFDVLGAQDSLSFVKAQKTAVAEQLAAAKRNFEVGTATITDTREAQARFDLVVAQEIAAENDLRVKKLALDTLTGRTGAEPLPLNPKSGLPELKPGDLGLWVDQAESEHPVVKQARLALEVARLEVDKAKAGEKPTLDAYAGFTRNLNLNGTTANLAASTSHVNAASAGVNFTLPLYAGGALQNRIRETLALEDKARADLDNASRTVVQTTRTAFLGLQSGQGQVKALEAAEASSQSALDANKLGYQVGVRINIDVLNAQSQLYQTKASLAKARYDVLVGGLKLRQASGVLKPEDLQEVNGVLQGKSD